MDNKDEATLASQSQAAQPSIGHLEAYERVREEFELAVTLGRLFDTDSAMLNVDALLRAHLASQSQATRAVPEGWAVERVGEAIHIKRADGKWTGFMPSISPAHALTYEFLSAILDAPASVVNGDTDA